MRKYTKMQILGMIVGFFIPPVSIWFLEGFGHDFWIDVLFCICGLIPGTIHCMYVWSVWIERKWQTKRGNHVTDRPFLIFSREFEQRSRWKGNGQDGIFGYFDDNIKGGEGRDNTVGGLVDEEKAKTPVVEVSHVDETGRFHQAVAKPSERGRGVSDT